MNQVQESEAVYAEVSVPVAKEKFSIDENECYGNVRAAPLKKTVGSDGNKNVAASDGKKKFMIVIILLIVLLIFVVASCLLYTFCT